MVAEPGSEDAVRPQYAPFGRRLAAGIVDAVAVTVIVGGLFWIHLKFVGALVPLWTIAAVALAWSVVPVWKFKATLGLRLFDLEIVNTSGGKADLLEVAVRELIGRGIVAAAYLGSFIVGVVSAILGVGSISMPVGLGLILFVGAGGMLTLAGVGQFAMLLRPDRRSLADLLGKVVVVEAPPAAEPQQSGPPLLAGTQPAALEVDEEWLVQQEKKRTIHFAIGEIVLVAIAVGMPFLNSVRVESINPHAFMAQKQADTELASLRRSFEGNPAGKQVAGQLIDELRYRGDKEGAEAVLKQYREARRKADAKREAMMMNGFETQRDWATLVLLLELYEEHDRKVDARAAWGKYLEKNEAPDDVASYGIWLYQNDLNLDAIDTFDKAFAAGYDGGDAHAYRGLALEALDRKKEARQEYLNAIERDESLSEDLDYRIERLDGELGPRKGKKKGRKRKRR